MNIKIAFSCDQTYVRFLATTIASILKNADYTDELEFYVMDGGLTAEDKTNIQSLSSIKEFTIKFIDISNIIANIDFTVPSELHFSKAAYFRFFIAEILKDINKVLYLDIDIVVLSSLAELYSVDVEEHYFAAGIQYHTLWGTAKEIMRLNIFGKKYFNSGVLLINLQRWRDENLALKLITTMNEIKGNIRYVDQDVMNHYFNDFKVIDKKWNCEAEFYETYPDIRIVHYQGGDKFSFSSSLLLKKYIALTPYKEFPQYLLEEKKITSTKKYKQAIKEICKKIILFLFANRKIAFIFDKLGKLARGKIKIQKKTTTIKTEFLEHALEFHFPDKIVQRGPFKGMRYPSHFVTDDFLFSKLLGCYEYEIQYLINEIIVFRPEQIINIGYHGIYYTVGLALRCPTAIIYAFEADETIEQTYCSMAQFNQVQERIRFQGKCKNEKQLLSLPANKKSVIICDIEGFEKKLLTQRVFTHFRSAFFLIEIHDCFDIEISRVIEKSFAKTHSYTEVVAINDIKKTYTYKYPEIDNYSLALKKELVSENRPSGMKWYFLSPKQHSNLF